MSSLSYVTPMIAGGNHSAIQPQWCNESQPVEHK